jgi:general secretion pathway protein D
MALRILSAIFLTALLASCTSVPDRYPVRSGRVAGQAPAAPAEDADSAAEAGTGEERPPATRLEPPARAASTPLQPDPSTQFPSGNALTVAVDAMPLRDFVHQVFGELLKVSYVIAENTQGLDQPVTLNVQKPISSRALYRLASELLAERKVGVTFKDGVYFVGPVDGKGQGGVSIGYGRRPQDVPEAAGNILQVIPLRYGPSVSIERTVRDLVDVKVFPDPQQSALFVTGERQAILRVLDIVRLLDQPATRASQVGLLNLTYVGSREFTEQMLTLLENEGIPAGVGRAEGKNVAMVPLDQLGSVVVFASGVDLLERVEFWARQVDRPNQGPALQYFVYHPKYARASDLGESLAPLIGVTEGARAPSLARDTRSALGAAGAAGAAIDPTRQSDINQQNVMRRETAAGAEPTKPVSIQGEGLTLSVDPRSNSLIFYTTGLRYESLLPMVRRLDVPPKQILLEATIAEVTLSGEFAYGVEFAVTDGKFSASTEGGIGLPGTGLDLSYISSITDSIRLKLSATNNLVNILSNPMLVVRDGVQATIAVGNDVPTVGATASDPIQSDRQITTVLYRRTGLRLNIRPTINAQGLVVMEIDQNISNTVPGASGVEGAPVFFDRSVTTEVVARSGQSILLAGLISESNSDTSTSVPWLGDIPGLGWLFKGETRSREKTELVLLITPRIIDTPDDWDTVQRGLEQVLEHLEFPAPVAASSGTPAPEQAPAGEAPAP